MANKEATARVKIDRLLEAADWRFFPDGGAPANIRLESGIKIKSSDLNALGDNFENAHRGFIDFLLTDAKGFPLISLEAKSEDKNPLSKLPPISTYIGITFPWILMFSSIT